MNGAPLIDDDLVDRIGRRRTASAASLSFTITTRARAGVLRVREAAAREDVAAVDVGPIRRVVLDARVQRAILVLERRRRCRRAASRRRSTAARPMPERLLVRDRRVAPLGARARIARIAALEAADRPPVDEERRRAGGGDVARERLVHAAHDRRQRDDDEHADRDAEDRERRAALVRREWRRARC